MASAKTNRFSHIIDGITGKDRETRIWCIVALGMLKIQEHADGLIDLLGSPDEGIVTAVLEALGRIGNPRSVKYILEFLSRENPVLVEKALVVLASFDLKPVLDVVLKAAGPDRPPQIRRRLLNCVSGLKDPQVAAAMSEVLGQTQDPALLVEALGYFTRFPCPEKKPAFKLLAPSQQWEIAMGANLALSRIQDETARGQLRKLVKSPAHPIRHALVQGMNKAPMIEDRELYEALFRDPHPQIRALALKGWHLFSPSERHQILIDWLTREKEDAVRYELMKLAVHEKSPVFYEEFVKNLNSSIEPLKRLGREGLVAIGPAIADKIIQAFPKSPLVLKEQMVLILGTIKAEKARRLIEQCLVSKERWLRLNAIEAMALLGDASFVPRCVEMVKKEDDVWVRATLLSALSRIGSGEQLPLFAENLKHVDARVRANALEGFKQLGENEHMTIVQPYLRDPNDRVRVNSAITLWKMGDTSVLTALTAMTKETTKWMKSSAAFALGEIGDPSVTPCLIDLLNDNEDVVYRNALEALVKIGDSRCLIPILKERDKKRLSEECFTVYLNRLSEKLRRT
jgi:HEAT repeat protein